MSNNLANSWQQIRRELKNSVTDSIFHLWLDPLAARKLDGCTLVLEAPDEIRSWVTDRFGRLLSACATRTLNCQINVELVGPESSTSRSCSQAQRLYSPGKTSTNPRHNNGTASPPPPEPVNPRFTFDQFVIGDSNRLAHGAALAVAEMPGLAYNPLFICGKPGLGKTHLLHSIANYVTTYGDGLTVRYTTVESFTNHFLSALQVGGMDAFKAAYRGVDVLLIDDVQFLQSKLKTEQEFFHTFNALHAAGAQVVLTSDRPPRDMEALEDRLRERFEAGLITEVKPPDFEMRLTILRKRVQQDGICAVEPSALELIAERVTTNVRALEGALIRVVAFSSLTNRSVTQVLAGEVLSGLYPDLRKRQPSVCEIQDITSTRFEVSCDDLVSPNRSPAVTWPRQVAMYLARELTDETLPAIGQAFGGRAHTTVLHAHRRITGLLANDAQAYDLVKELTEELIGQTRPRKTATPERMCS